MRLLSPFDEYLLGYTDRSAVLAPEAARHVQPPGGGMFRGTVVIDGRVAGTWKRTNQRGGVVVTLQPFTPLSAASRKLLAAEVDRYGTFVGKPARSNA